MATFSLVATIPPNPSTGFQLGQVCQAYLATRFADPTTAPATDATVPDGLAADAGPVTTTTPQATFIVASFASYMISYYDPADRTNGGTYHVYWL